MMFFKVAEKSQNIWLTFASNFFDKKFKNSCNIIILYELDRIGNYVFRVC